MKQILLVAIVFAAALQAANPNLVPGAGAWRTWSPYPALAPKSDLVSDPAGSMLRITARDFSSFGKWLASGIPVQGGRFYRFEVLYKPERIVDEQGSVGIMLTWSSGAKDPLQRDYVDRTSPADNGWRHAVRTFRAPDRTTSVTVELWLSRTESGSVSFKEPKLVEVPPQEPRKVRVVTTKITDNPYHTIKENLGFMGDVLDHAGREHPDIILLTETFLNRGVPAKMYETAMPIPGPATEVLAEKARKYKSYVIAGLLESEGTRVYNTAVLMDREGRLAGKYRKTHLPLAEVEYGITPGSDYPVFDTDFGRIGMLICWDVVFPEPMRILRLKGAEIVFLPIAGDPMPGHWDTITRARAMDNGVFFVSSVSSGTPSRIVNPEGEVLAEATEGLATAELNLDRETRIWWMSVGPSEGQPKSLFIQERRPDTYGAIAAGER